MNTITVGSRVRLVAPDRARHKDFPGYGSPDYRDFYVDHPVGMTGKVTSIESHGMNPWTRYSIEYDDDSRSSGVLPSQIEMED